MKLTLKHAVAVTMLLGSCTSYGDIRAKPPYETRVVMGDAQRLSDCTLNAFAMNYSKFSLTVDYLTFTKIMDGDTIHLAAHVSGNVYFWDVAFVPLQKRQTRVEARPLGTSVWGNKPNYPSDIWQLIEGCADR